MFYGANRGKHSPKRKLSDFMRGDTTPRKLTVAELKRKFIAALGEKKKKK